MTSSLIILMSDESASKATKLGYGQLAKTEADVQHTTAEEEEKCNGASFNESNQPRGSNKINDRHRARQRSFGHIIGLRPAPNDFSPCREGKPKHRTRRGKCRHPEPDR